MSNKKQKEKEQQKQQEQQEQQPGEAQENRGAQGSETGTGESGTGLGASGENEQQAAGAKSEQVEELQRRIKELELENSDLKAQYLRKQADFENFRKRMQREKQESIKYANTDLLQDLVAIIDDFERAIKSSEESRDFDSFHSGIQLIERQLVNMLENKYGLTRIESEGEEFDPQKHEAIAMVESPEHDVQTVIEDYQKGYMINDRVLRHAKVRVAVPAKQADGVAGGTEAASAEQSEEKAPDNGQANG
jgi:molecular chaperone GrpE